MQTSASPRLSEADTGFLSVAIQRQARHDRTLAIGDAFVSLAARLRGWPRALGKAAPASRPADCPTT